MIPSNSISSIYVKIAGEDTLLAMAQSNLFSNIERIAKIRTHTFLANNGQTKFGISRNYGNQRYYSWEDTIIDCRNNPTLTNSKVLENIEEIISDNNRFIAFKTDIEERSQGLIKVQPFFSILYGEDNMRYNIRRSSKIEDFDIIRIGICLLADNDDEFTQALLNLKNWENPVRFKIH